MTKIAQTSILRLKSFSTLSIPNVLTTIFVVEKLSENEHNALEFVWAHYSLTQAYNNYFQKNTLLFQ